MTTRLRRHRLFTRKRLALGVVAGAVAGVAMGIGVHAFMNAISTNTLGLNSGAVNAEGTLSTPTVSGRDVTVTWPADTVTGGTATTYYVLRDNSGASGTCSGIQSASTFSCTDTSVPSGTHTYTVVPTYLSWTGASSSVTSPAVGTPALSVSPTSTTTLPKNLSGSASNFADSETITFRLDDAITGTVLTTSPATVATGTSGGTASPTITVPANIADGSHTIFAVGNLGDTASAAFTVSVPATLSFTNGTFSSLPATLTGGAITYFRASESVSFHLDSAGGTALTSTPTTVPIGANGQTSSAFTVQVPAGIADGTHTVYAVGGSGSQATYAITVSVPSTFSIDAGQTFTSLSGTVTGGAVTYFGASENLIIRLDSSSGTILSTSPSTVTTGANGQVSGFTATIPANISHGTHTLVALGNTTGLTATSNTFTVSVNPTFSITSAQSLPASSLPAGVTGGAVTYFANTENLTIHLDTVGGTVLATTPSPLTTGSNGQVSGFSITIPVSTLGGTHTLWAVGNTSGVSAQSNSFTVAASATNLSPTTGVVGSSASVVAQGFAPTHALTVTVGGASATITGGSNTNSSGSSTVTFTVPAAPNGSRAVVVSDSTSNATSGTNFTVTASATGLSPTSGAVGTTGVTIQADGFAASTALTVKVAGNTAVIASGGTTGTNGSSLVTFTIPAAPKGSQTVTVSDGTSTATSATNFTIQTALSVSPSSGAVGTSGVTLTGTGFVAGQTVSVTFGGNSLTISPSPTTVSASGSWSSTFTVPASPSGARAIVATDGSGGTASTSFTVTPSITLNPTSGAAGSTDTITGTGFAASSALTATFNASAVTLSVTTATGTNGSFTGATYTVPSLAAGPYTVLVKDAANNQATATFTITTTTHTCTISTDTGDTYIRNGEAQHGAATTMITNANGGSSSPDNALVQFGILTSTCAEGGTLPASATVTNATLTLTATSATARTIGAALAGATWSEGTLTWATATTAEKSPTGANIQSVPSTTVAWAVTADVQAVVAGAVDGGWVLWDSGTGNSATSFNTKEAATGRPVLVITYH